MPVQAMFAPWSLTVGGTKFKSGSQYVANPWAAGSPVWLQCTTGYVAGSGQSEFGIRTIYQINDAGQFEVVNFGDDRFGTYEDIWWVPRFYGVVVAARTYDASIEGTITLFLWG